MKGDVIFSEFVIVIKTYTDVKKLYNLAFFGRTRIILIKISLLLDSKLRVLWNNTEKWTLPALRSLQKYQAISKMTIAAATDPPM